ncbi:hypothetical protein HYPSUDRAFT_199045 [Hypholoma sublateritium FD-334 SS-4]|uniref:RecQ mediated genome instability protein 1 OB-fold domain-containing protein n=1 Tax=Hypholoma sublateritium (strain FD-334 SS-4) TaxID=945553 RepID=A0A0D2MQM7_HYPSF|nr:hypothetical protein HYPSUDRAFT_199045 [Hypholoma sublateritium FD-334 SS-4]
MQDFAQLAHFAEEQIIRSNLASSTVRGTGFGPVNAQATGRLPNTPLLVQVVAITEVVQSHTPRVYKLRLSDGESVADAIAFSPSANCNLGFYDLPLGYKMQLKRPLIRHGMIVLQAQTITLLGGGWPAGRLMEKKKTSSTPPGLVTPRPPHAQVTGRGGGGGGKHGCRARLRLDVDSDARELRRSMDVQHL